MDRAGGGGGRGKGRSGVIWPVALEFLVWQGQWCSPTQDRVMGARVWKQSSAEVSGGKDGKRQGQEALGGGRMWQSACLSCSVSGDNPSVSVSEGAIPSPAPRCPLDTVTCCL